MFLEFPEGATPLHDESDLLIPWVRTMSDLNRVEAENILQAQERYLRVTSSTGWKWFNYGVFQEIHRAMFGKVWAWAGILRGVEILRFQLRESCRKSTIISGIVLSQYNAICHVLTAGAFKRLQ